MISKIIKFFLPFYKDYALSTKFTRAYYDSYLGFLLFKLGIRKVYWQHHKSCIIGSPRKIYVGKNSRIGRSNSYIQGEGGIYVGDYVGSGPNVGIISVNHDLNDHRKSVAKSVYIGNYCWLGMGCVILPGVTLGPRTIVGANAVVTKSFPDGYCVIGGNPAKVIKLLNKDDIVCFRDECEFHGFIPAKDFERVKKKYIDL